MTKINADRYRQGLENFYARYIPCGTPTQYEQGFMDGLSFAIKSITFYTEEIDGQITLDEWIEENQ